MQGLMVGNVGFHARPTGAPGDFHGFMYGPGGIQGVRGGVGVSSAAAQRPGRHGEIDLRVFKTARVVSLNGAAIAPSAGALDQLGIVHGGLGADGDVMPLTYYSEGGLVLNGSGRVILQDFEQERGGNPKATYALSLSMRDPRWYGGEQESVSAGDSVTFGNVALASHRGNTIAQPRFTVAPLAGFNLTAGYQIKGKGQTFEVPGPLNLGQVDKVDFATHTVRRDGVLVKGVVPRSFTIRSGEEVPWRFWPLSGAGSAKCQPRDTYF